ncbi:unnamed protein product [Heligmosomoides polygyrus]|uniref:Reverse transcriptase domain-containing protein n=1 Tax=Heligmosomoides polygyrus TaxID=6339 RepID=A0A183FXX2_HELPZ|nr:unnamed protein product [Heligmosomoides polygyrus]
MFIDLKKAFDAVETEAVVEVVLPQGVPSPHFRVLRELYSGFTAKISPCYNGININVRDRFGEGIPHPQNWTWTFDCS